MSEIAQWAEAHPIGTGALVVIALVVIWIGISILPDLMRYIRISRM